MKLLRTAKKIIAENILPRVPSSLLRFPVNSVLMIEPTNRCNLSCPLCPAATVMKRKRGDMKFDDFAKIIDEMHPFAKKIYFWNFGEPFLNAEIFRMAEYAEKKGLYVKTSTNSTIWSDKIYDDIFSSRISEVIVCLDGITGRTHEFYRKGSNFEKTVAGIRRLCEEKKKRNSLKPVICLQFVVMKENEHEIPQLLGMAGEMGIDTITLKSVSLGSWVTDLQRKLNAESFLPGQDRYRRYTFSGNELVLKRDIRVCSWARRNGVVLWNGDLAACCYDYDGESVMGNVLKEGYLSVLKSEKFRQARKRMITRYYPICKRCQISSVEIKPVRLKG
ncbi:MAG: radical SAM protein [bacterium]|nr:radical SAM protein [bacterium]